MNKCLLFGRLGRDPELKNAGETKVCAFNMATSMKSKDKEYTEWHRVIAFGRLAEISSQYLSKGSQVLVDGRIQTRSYEGKDGTTKYATEIIANAIEFAGSKRESQSSFDGPGAFDDSEELPF